MEGYLLDICCRACIDGGDVHITLSCKCRSVSTSEIEFPVQWNGVVNSWSTSADALCNALCHIQGNCWSGKHGKHDIALLCQRLWTFCHLRPDRRDNKTQRKARHRDCIEGKRRGAPLLPPPARACTCRASGSKPSRHILLLAGSWPALASTLERHCCNKPQGSCSVLQLSRQVLTMARPIIPMPQNPTFVFPVSAVPAMLAAVRVLRPRKAVCVPNLWSNDK